MNPTFSLWAAFFQIFLWGAAISACEKGRHWTAALQLLEDMASAKVEPHVITYNAVPGPQMLGGFLVNAPGFVAPWCWNIYLQNWLIYGVNVGKYSSTMGCIWVLGLRTRDVHWGNGDEASTCWFSETPCWWSTYIGLVQTKVGDHLNRDGFLSCLPSNIDPAKWMLDN